NPALFTSSGIPAVLFDELLAESGSHSAEPPTDSEVLSEARSDSVAIVLYTSGSTGCLKVCGLIRID
ncbi:hypothetical protein JYU34_022733, partial [Plutella xylostella]